MTIAENIQRVQESIATAAARAHRPPESITLIAVSKTHPAESVLAAVNAGLQHFGENRVEEASIKIPIVTSAHAAPLHWHMIGHLQSRKAKDAVPLFKTIHSVDTLKLAQKLSNSAQENAIDLRILLEINISGEESKSGFAAARWQQDAAQKAELWQTATDIAALPNITVVGLMTMAPIVSHMEQTRPIFAGLVNLRDALQTDLHITLPELSMGMTDDYSIAIEEGATLIRIGRAIFGER
jgi:PLP dependent protein